MRNEPLSGALTPPGMAPAPVADPPAFTADLVGDRVDLPSGGWVQLRHLDDLRSKHRNYITSQIPEDGEITMPAIKRMQYAVAETMIIAWHLPYEPELQLPSERPIGSPDGSPAPNGLIVPVQPLGSSPLAEMTVKDENLLHQELEAVANLINPKAVTPDDHKDPDSPTGPAGA